MIRSKKIRIYPTPEQEEILRKHIDGCRYIWNYMYALKYKCEEKGIKFHQVDRFFPSTKRCSCCGNIKEKISLSERIYKCEKCGAELDRDYNAALNLKKCGEAL